MIIQDLKFKIIENQGSRLLLIEPTHNWTNQTGNATKHCEVLGIQNISRFNFTQANLKSKISFQFQGHFRSDKFSNALPISYSNFVDLDCFVTVEPCIMCGSALKLSKTRKVYFIARNSKFGGICSILKLEGLPYQQFDFRQKQVINLLKSFYDKGNQRLRPQLRHRKVHKAQPNGLLGKRPDMDGNTDNTMKIDN